MLLAQAKTRWVLVSLLASLPALLAVRGGAQDSTLPQVRYPDPDPGVQWLPTGKKAQDESAGRFRVFHDFRFTDRLKESGITFVHQAVDDVRKTYKAGPLRPRQRHRRGRRGRRRPRRPLLRQPARRQRALEEPGRRPVPRTSPREAGVGLAGRDRRRRLLRRRRQRRRPGPLRHHGPRWATRCSRTTARGASRTSPRRPGVDYVGHSSGAVFFDYDSDGLLDLFVVNVGEYTTDEQGAAAATTSASTDAFSGHLHPERTETSVLYRNLGGNRFEDVTAETGLVDGGWSGDASVADFNGTAGPTSTSSTCRGTTTTTRTRAARRFVDKTAELFPKTPWGAMGDQVLRLRQRRPASTSSSPTCTRT